MHRPTFLLCNLLAFYLAVAPSVAATPNVALAASKQEVLILLQGYEWVLSPESFESLPAETYFTLINIASDTSVLSFQRGRAVAALSLYQNDEVWLFFKRSLKEALSLKEGLREHRRILDSMCKAFSKDKGGELKRLLRPWLQVDDSHFRIQTAICLQGLQAISADESTKLALRDYHDAITQTWERDKVFR